MNNNLLWLSHGLQGPWTTEVYFWKTLLFFKRVEIEIKMHQCLKWTIIQWSNVDIFLNQLPISPFQISEVDLELISLSIENKVNNFIEPKAWFMLHETL